MIAAKEYPENYDVHKEYNLQFKWSRDFIHNYPRCESLTARIEEIILFVDWVEVEDLVLTDRQVNISVFVAEIGVSDNRIPQRSWNQQSVGTVDSIIKI